MTETAPPNPWKVGFIIVTLTVVLWIAYALTVPRLAMSWEKSNQFGGMFGGIGALFSGLALGGVVAAIWLKKQTLEATLTQLRGTAEAQERQVQMAYETARLNTLSALTNGYGLLYNAAGSGPFASEARKKVSRYLTEIEKTLPQGSADEDNTTTTVQQPET